MSPSEKMEDLATPTGLVASDLSGDNRSSDSIEHEETLTLGSQASESMPTEWTDEKHSLYLKSMEASFVKQLHNSSELLGWRSRKDCSSGPKSSRQMHISTRNPTGKFKVLRDGCWDTINFRREESQLSKADETCVLSANPWIRHFRSGCRHHIVTSSALQEKAVFANTSNRLPVSRSHLCLQDSVVSNSEMMDQNFVDEDVETENSSRMCSTKRKKTSVVATSSNDQVVPFGKFPVTEDVAENCVFPKK